VFEEGSEVAQPLSRRDRLRAATVAEIRQTARALLVAEGIEGLSLRAIAREMGMTAPALYRYFPSREDLLEHLIADLYDEVSDAMEAARDQLPADDIGGRLMTVSRVFRRWSVDHPREFALIFGSPIPGVRKEQTGEQADVASVAGRRFGLVFGDLVARGHAAKPMPVPADGDIEPALRLELERWRKEFPVPVPLGLVQLYLSCWVRLYGIVTMEVFGHLDFALDDAEPLFEAELRGLAALLGMPEAYRPPVTAAGR
jgi:AcrR family transcriptional regulator